MTNGSKIVLTISSEIPHPLSVQEITIESDIFSAQRKIDPFESVKVFSETASFAFCRRFKINYICLFNYLFISSQMSAKPYFIGSTGILLLW